jgi:hypothetical protein
MLFIVPSVNRTMLRLVCYQKKTQSQHWANLFVYTIVLH